MQKKKETHYLSTSANKFPETWWQNTVPISYLQSPQLKSPGQGHQVKTKPSHSSGSQPADTQRVLLPQRLLAEFISLQD